VKKDVELVQKTSHKTGNPYTVLRVHFSPDYYIDFFINNDQKALISLIGDK
jgi:hypothetical protein